MLPDPVVIFVTFFWLSSLLEQTTASITSMSCFAIFIFLKLV